MAPQYISLHVGRAGIETGGAIWTQYSAEHGIEKDGTKSCYSDNEGLDTVFNEHEDGQYAPRAVFLDMDAYGSPLFGQNKEYIQSSQIVLGNDDGGHLFARGRYLYDCKGFAEKANEEIRKQAEACDSFQGFEIHRALGGGTGAGYGNKLIATLEEDFLQKPIVEYAIMPTLGCTSSSLVTDPYNTVLALADSQYSTVSTVMFDNYSMYKVLDKVLCIEYPDASSINRLYAQSVSSLTTSLRFGGDFLGTLAEFSGLSPVNHLKYQVCGMTPYLRSYQSVLDTPEIMAQPSEALKNTTMEIDLLSGQFMSAAVLFRGDVTPNDAISACGELDGVNFASVGSQSVRVGMNSQIPCAVTTWDQNSPSQTTTVLSNSTSMAKVLKTYYDQFVKVYSMRAYVHWYVGEGMEEGEFTESLETIRATILDYENPQVHIDGESDGEDSEDSE